jgi:uncharacterized membrane protein YphA (DoxX/SURF4 family)
MNTAPGTRKQTWTALAGLLARWLLGGSFVYLGLAKALHPVDFLKLVRQYDLTQSAPVLDSIAALLPWFEVGCGLLLVAGVAVRGAALVSLLLLIPFTVVVWRRALALKAVLAIPLCAVKFDCGCGHGEEFFCRKLTENLVWIGLAVWLLAGAGRQACLRYALKKSDLVTESASSAADAIPDGEK